MTGRLAHSKAFTMIELVIVLVIIAVISAIAIPRLTRGASNADEAALLADLHNLRNAIETYRAEHEGHLPTAGDIVNQLTRYSNVAGDSFADTPDVANGIIYGPYLNKVPKVRVGTYRGNDSIKPVADATTGWVYDVSEGTIIVNSEPTDVDDRGIKFTDY